jgi:hypothetical protein
VTPAAAGAALVRYRAARPSEITFSRQGRKHGSSKYPEWPPERRAVMHGSAGNEFCVS